MLFKRLVGLVLFTLLAILLSGLSSPLVLQGLLLNSRAPSQLAMPLVALSCNFVLYLLARQRGFEVRELTEPNRTYPLSMIAMRLAAGDTLGAALARVTPAQVLAWCDYLATAILAAVLRLLAVLAAFANLVIAIVVAACHPNELLALGHVPAEELLATRPHVAIVFGSLFACAAAIVERAAILSRRTTLDLATASRELEAYFAAVEQDADNPKTQLRLLSAVVIGHLGERALAAFAAMRKGSDR
jgi:hypothetical protein